MRISFVAFWGGTALWFLVVALTGSWSFLGGLIGYWWGFLNSAWLYRDSARSVDLDLLAALRNMRRSFFARLGMLTLVVIIVSRRQDDWLASLAVGFAAGLLVSLFSMFYGKIIGGKG